MSFLALAIGAYAVGTGMEAWSQYKQDQAASKMYQYNRAVSLRYARAVREIRNYEESLYWGEAAKVYPRQKVITAAAGLEISGTPLKVMKKTRQKLEEQGRAMQYEKEMEISRIKAEAAISGMRAKLAKRAGRYGAFSTLLAGGSQLAFMGYKYGG